MSKEYRLYIFIDSNEKPAKYPIMILVNKQKCIGTLSKEIESKKNIPQSNQHWIFNEKYCSHDAALENILHNMTPFNNGLCGVLFNINKKEKDKLPSSIDIYLKQKYGDMDLTKRWKEPIDSPIVISEKIDMNKKASVSWNCSQCTFLNKPDFQCCSACGYIRPKDFRDMDLTKRLKKPIDNPIIITEKIDMNKIALMGWNCSQCTFLNKPYFRCCSVCGYSRPEDYVIPNDFNYTTDDVKFIEDEKKREEEQKKKEKLERERQEKEKKENLERLKKMYKDEDVSYSTEETECPICCLEFGPGKAIILKACFHTVCKDCFTDFLRNAADPKVKCLIPDCQGIIEDREIKGVLSQKDYEKYQKLNLRTAEGKLGRAAFHCKTVNCEAFVLFDDNVNFFHCPVCKKENCILCGAIHEGKNCKEYQDDLNFKASNDIAAQKDKKFLEDMIKNGEAMLCPGCKIIVQKKSGCDWMKCNMCKMELCWATKGPRWGPNGKGDTSGGCKCERTFLGFGKKCHPSCSNCH